MFAFAAFGQRNLFAVTGSGAKGLAGRLAMEAAARRRHPGAAGGPGAQPGASFLQARWARASGRSGTAAPPRDRAGGRAGGRGVRAADPEWVFPALRLQLFPRPLA